MSENKTPKIVEFTAIKNSSNISAVSYTDTNDLVVRFNNGGEYLYKGVPKEIYTTMTKSQSAGKYLTEAVKGKFEFKKLDKKQSDEMKPNTLETLDQIDQIIAEGEKTDG